jgi:hypothetical protein
MVATPLSPEELLGRADLAGYARVLSVQNGRAQLFFTRLLKGKPKRGGLLSRLSLGRTATVILRGQSEPMLLGDWSDDGAYVPGGRVKTHLRWDNRQNAYETLWWNAVSPA